MDNLQKEINYRLSSGWELLSVRAMNDRFKALGYALDRSLDCRSTSRYITGDRAGETYPACTTGLKEIDSAISFANVNARRDDNFRKMMELRNQIFAVSRGAILEV